MIYNGILVNFLVNKNMFYFLELIYINCVKDLDFINFFFCLKLKKVIFKIYFICICVDFNGGGLNFKL